MSITDKFKHYFECPKCGCKDQITIKERGYGLNTRWDEGENSHLFDITWTEPGFCGPEVIECTCKQCKTPAKHYEK